MTKKEFIAKYEGWFSYTRREELKKEMETDLEEMFAALRQPHVVGRSEQFCSCSFVMIMRDVNTDVAFCAECGKEVNEQN